MRTQTELPPPRCQVLIIGGGPAGSTAAAILAREGIHTVVVEKEVFPRYHIGESLLTSLLPVLRFIGAEEKVAAHGFVKKPGAYFRLKQGLDPGYIDFATRGPFPHSYQVKRAEFDELLLEHAASQGAQVYEGVSVRDIEFAGELPASVSCLHVSTRATGTVEFDYLLDASGLNGIMAARYLRNRVYEPTFANVALGSYWTHYTPFKADQPGAFFSEALADGSGWMWAIPLHDGTLSLGAVIHRNTFRTLREGDRPYEQILSHCISLCPVIQRMVEGAERSAVRVWQDYSYCAASFSGTNYRLLGDAAGFIDPLFSTGVHMAQLGAISASASIAAVLRQGMAPERAAAFHDGFVRRAFARFVLYVAGAYRQIRNQSEVVFFAGERAPAESPERVPEMEAELFQRAFGRIQPLLSGTMDLARQHLGQREISEAMDCLAAVALEEFGYDSGMEIAKMLARGPDSTSDVDGLVGRDDPLDGLQIRLERGRLGLVEAR